MERCVCIHGHFYQPPRENPWLESIEIQDSAFPYHDWNEKVTAECYGPNAASRQMDAEGRITDIVSNYARISFNFGPTLLSWMEHSWPGVYAAVLEADRQSVVWRSGHGAAIAQVYNHIIMPLANSRDKRTQVIWGIKDFEHRFKRFPEGMWLSETAVDLETLDILAERGIKYTVLAPRQAKRTRRAGSGKWKDAAGGIDPTRAYVCSLPSGRRITIFFYDGPISQAVAFEKLLNRGEDFARRLLSGFSEARNWPQIMNIATDGETYGHHHRFGDMALTAALNHIENKSPARLTNYGEYLSQYPPSYEVEIIENTSWSCYHGIERWRSDCGCSTGGHPGWNQKWRKPLRAALDWLGDILTDVYEREAAAYLEDPWQARDEYIDVILDRSGGMDAFFDRQSRGTLSGAERVKTLKLLEMQRHAMLMYTSCGWFFDDVSGIETVQVIEYAGRAVQLAGELTGTGLEEEFIGRLSEAKSNLTDRGDAARIYEEVVKPAVINLNKVGAHYAVSSLFEEYADKTVIYGYGVERLDYHTIHAGKTKLAIGRISVSSHITVETETVSFCVFHLGGHAINGGVRTYRGDESFQDMKNEITAALEGGDFAELVRLMDTHFGMHNYSLKDLFRDEQRKILNLVISSTLEEYEAAYRGMYENSRVLMGFLSETGIPVPKALYTSAEFILNLDLRKAFEEGPDLEKLRAAADDIMRWDLPVDSLVVEFAAGRTVEELMRRAAGAAPDALPLATAREILELMKSLSLEMNVWEMQNIYFRMAKTLYPDVRMKARSGDADASAWVETFKDLGKILSFNIALLLPGG